MPHWRSRRAYRVRLNPTERRVGRKTKRGERHALPFFPCTLREELLLWRRDNVLGGLGHAELHHGLGLDLDGLAGLRVAAHASLALGLHQTADTGDYEHPALLGLLDGGLRQQVKESCGLLVG